MASRLLQNDYEPVFLLLRSLRVRMSISTDDAMIAKEQKEPWRLPLLTRKHCLKAVQLLVKVNISILIHFLLFFEMYSRMYNKMVIMVIMVERKVKKKKQQNIARMYFSNFFFYWRGYSINKFSQCYDLTCDCVFNFGWFIERVTQIWGYTEQKDKL